MRALRSCHRLLPLVVFVLAACGGSVPQTGYYQLTESVPRAEQRAGGVLVVEALRADAAYDDDRIVYRSGEFRLDYYHYHRWSASSGSLVADFLRRGYEAQGLFRAVTDAIGGEGGVVLSGRVVALERVDGPEDEHKARVALALRLRSALTGDLLWTKTVRVEQAVEGHSVEALAKALSSSLSQIVSETGPVLADVARKARAKGGLN